MADFMTEDEWRAAFDTGTQRLGEWLEHHNVSLESDLIQLIATDVVGCAVVAAGRSEAPQGDISNLRGVDFRTVDQVDRIPPR